MLFICSTSFSRYVYTVYTFSILTFSCMPIKSNLACLRNPNSLHTSSPLHLQSFNHLHHASHHIPRVLVMSCPSTIQPSTSIFLNTILRPGIGVITTRPARSFRRRTTDLLLLRTGYIPAYAHHPAPLNITFFSTILAN